MNENEMLELMGNELIDKTSLLEMVCRFSFTLAVVWVMIYFLYFRKSRRLDYYFTYIILSISVFFMIYLLGGVKLKIGFALGLFAIFGILRYRTETIPVREMTYMFSVISISVINALANDVSLAELVFPNAVILIVTWLFEHFLLKRDVVSKLVLYDRIALIVPERREELIEDLRNRTGLKVTKVSVGSVDFLKDSAVLKVYYEYNGEGMSHINNTLKISKAEWNEVKEPGQ